MPYQDISMLFGSVTDKFEDFFEYADFCCRVVIVGLLYYGHNKGKQTARKRKGRPKMTNTNMTAEKTVINDVVKKGEIVMTTATNKDQKVKIRKIASGILTGIAIAAIVMTALVTVNAAAPV